MKAKLNSTTIKNLSAKDEPFEVVDIEIIGFLLRVQPTGRKTFYYSYRNKSGQRKRIKIGMLDSDKTVAQARDDALELAAKASKGEDLQSLKVSLRTEAQAQLKNTLRIFLDDQYLPWATANHKSGLETVQSVKRSFQSWLDRPMSDIKLKDIERWRTERLTNGLKPSSINRVANALRGVLTKAVEWQAIAEHPIAKLKNLKLDESPKVRYLSEKEDTSLKMALEKRDIELKAARTRGNESRHTRKHELLPDLSKFSYADRMTPLVIMALKTGMRRGELFDLQWCDVDFSNNVVTVIGETAKSSKTRHIPLNPTALTALKNWRKQAPLKKGRVFPADDKGNRLNNVKKSWISILKSAKITSFRWHDMRHDFASQLVMKGVPLNTVRELCGHANMNTTLRYAHLAPNHKSEAVGLLG